MSFLNNRSWFMKAIEEANWPVKEQDIILLEEEILKAESFLQQSQDLRKAGSGDDDDLTVYSDKDSQVSGLSVKSKELSRSKESVASSASSQSKSSSSSEESKLSHKSKESSSRPYQSLEVIPQY